MIYGYDSFKPGTKDTLFARHMLAFLMKLEYFMGQTDA